MTNDQSTCECCADPHGDGITITVSSIVTCGCQVFAKPIYDLSLPDFDRDFPPQPPKWGPLTHNLATL